jgi:uncharacterized membrane protein YcjF (UPF0283 family)
MQIPFATPVRVLLLVLLAMGGTGCQVIGDIFQAGMWVGVIGVVLVVAIIGFVVSKMRG